MSDINKFIENCKTLKYKIKHIEKAHRRYISSIEDMINTINSDYQTQQQFGIFSNHLQNILTTSIQNQEWKHNQINNIYKTVCRNIKVGGKHNNKDSNLIRVGRGKKSRCTAKTKDGKCCKNISYNGNSCRIHSLR